MGVWKIKTSTLRIFSLNLFFLLSYQLNVGKGKGCKNCFSIQAEETSRNSDFFVLCHVDAIFYSGGPEVAERGGGGKIIIVFRAGHRTRI